MRTHAVRLARLMLPAGNPLSRAVDRAEGCVLLLVVVLAIVLVPVMLMVGSLTYGNVMARAEAQARTHHQVVVTLVEDPPRSDGGGNATVRVRAEWQTPAGPRTGYVRTDHGRGTGDRVRAWFDENGDPAGAPPTQGDAALSAALVTVTGWLTATMALGLVHGGVKQLLDRRRYRAWGREWARVEPRWRLDPP